MAETYYIVFLIRSVKAAVLSFGNRNEQKTGVIPGLRSCEKINEQQKQI